MVSEVMWWELISLRASFAKVFSVNEKAGVVDMCLEMVQRRFYWLVGFSDSLWMYCNWRKWVCFEVGRGKLYCSK